MKVSLTSGREQREAKRETSSAAARARRAWLSACVCGLLMLSLLAGPVRGQAAGVAVTFDFAIPADTPDGPVYVAGTFNDWNPGDARFALVRSGPRATLAATIAPGPIEYKLTRGCWATVEKGAGHFEVGNRKATAAEGARVTGTVEEWAEGSCDGSKSPPLAPVDERVTKVELRSKALGITKTFYVYVPPEAAADSSLRFPSLYLFRGHENEWVTKTQDASRGGSDVIDVYLALRAARQIEPMILVFPGVTSDDGAVHSVATNMRNPGKQPGVGTGRFDDYVVKDLIPYVDKNYPTRKNARGVDGFSLGGTISMKFALEHPGLFETVGAFDGLYFFPEAANPRVVDANDTALPNPIFDGAFGTPRDRAYAGANNALTLLASASPRAVWGTRWLVEYGPESAEPNSSNFYRGDALTKLLARKGGTNLMQGPVPGAVHDWAHADEHMRRSLVIHSRELTSGRGAKTVGGRAA